MDCYKLVNVNPYDQWDVVQILSWLICEGKFLIILASRDEPCALRTPTLEIACILYCDLTQDS